MMLCVVFTTSRMYAGIYDDTLELLQFRGEFYKELPDAESLSGELLPVWIADALTAADVQGDVYPIETSLCFSIDFINTAFSLRNEVIEAFQHHNSYRLVHTDASASSFRPGLTINNEALPDNFVIIEAFDNAFNIYYHYWQEDKQLRQYKQIPELSKPVLFQKLRELFQVQTMSSGITLGDMVWEKFFRSGFEFYRGGPIELDWTDERLELSATYQVSDAEWKGLVNERQELFEPFLGSDILHKLDISEIILLGPYTRVLELDTWLEENSNVTDLTIVDQNINTREGVELVMQACLHKTRQKLKREQKEELQRKKDQLSKRDLLIRDIREQCTDPDKLEQYVGHYRERASAAGMPEGVLRWMIQDQLENQIIERSGEKHSESSSDITEEPVNKVQKEKAEEEIEGDSVAHAEGESPVEKTESETEEDLGEEHEGVGSDEETEPDHVSPITREEMYAECREQVATQVHVDEWYDAKEFMLCKGRKGDNEPWQVYRIIPIREFEDLENLNRFLELYQRESGYYDQTSEIQSDKFGRFYTRSWLSGTLLDDYASQIGLKKKQVLNQLTSKDLKLILAIWREINGLTFAVKRLEAANFLVVPGNRNDDAEVKVRIVGFTSETATRTEMEENVHLMLEKLLAPGVYTEMRSRFNL